MKKIVAEAKYEMERRQNTDTKLTIRTVRARHDNYN